MQLTCLSYRTAIDVIQVTVTWRHGRTVPQGSWRRRVKVDSRVWHIPEAVRTQAPEAALLLDAVNAAAWRTVSPVQLEEVRVRMAQMLCFAPGLERSSAQARAGGLDERKLSHVADYFRSDD